MDTWASVDATCSVSDLLSLVDDLTRYPEWLDIVARAERVGDADGDSGPAWVVDLRGRLGKIARSKRLRMVRTGREPGEVTFERREIDGRRHARWDLRAVVEPTGEGSRLTMHLHYGGSLWGPVLERMLRDEIARSRQRLEGLAAGRSGEA